MKEPIMYSPKQTDEILKCICKNFGESGKYIAHEIKSEYVHTDVRIAQDEEQTSYVTFGMGAREMLSPLDEFKRCELIMLASSSTETTSLESAVISGELMYLSKFPFRGNTWFGPYHTAEASEKFKETFGFDAFIFIPTIVSCEITNIGKVNFLTAVPIYNDELEWIMENDGSFFIDELFSHFNENEIQVNKKREHYIPSCDMSDMGIMNALGIDKETLEKLYDYFDDLKSSDVQISYEMIEKWIAENKK